MLEIKLQKECKNYLELNHMRSELIRHGGEISILILNLFDSTLTDRDVLHTETSEMP